jgi:hypothetical protein
MMSTDFVMIALGLAPASSARSRNEDLSFLKEVVCFCVLEKFFGGVVCVMR